MTKLQRVREIITGIITVLIALLMLLEPSEGYTAVIGILSLVYTVRGISMIIYYFTMARFMVGGRTALYIGIIMFDFGILTGTLTDVPHFYVLLYLIGIHAFSGAIEMMRASESRRYGGAWRLKLGHSIIDIIMALLCIVFLSRLSVAVIIYAIGLMYSSVLRIISACGRTKFVYIQ
jgi:uncharacterized membrane protein HdeD (DUF308 family)